MSAVVLDAEPLSLLARDQRGEAFERVRAVLTQAESRGWVVRVPSAVLAELYRGTAAEAGVDAAMARFGVRSLTTGQRVARYMGRLLDAHGLDSCHLADASVIATALRLGGGVVVTVDDDDLRRLASDAPTVTVTGLNG
jgi:predicted nucleic acid-binding protein